MIRIEEGGWTHTWKNNDVLLTCIADVQIRTNRYNKKNVAQLSPKLNEAASYLSVDSVLRISSQYLAHQP